MATVRDNGEFELILGNKQLLSVLFIVIVLLGVFFAMGFLAGRSTAGSPAATVAKNTPPPLDLAEPKPAPPVKGGKDLVAESKSEPAPVKKEEPRKVEPRREEPKKEEPRKAAPRAGGYAEKPPAGTYLQVAAARRADADNLQALLAKQGLSGYVTPVPNKADLFRVVVGPLNGNEQIAAAREKLKGTGITNGFVVKY